MEKKLKVEFMPGCFDDFEGTQEELNQLMEQIIKMAETGELFETADAIIDSDEVEEIEIESLQVQRPRPTLQ